MGREAEAVQERAAAEQAAVEQAAVERAAEERAAAEEDERLDMVLARSMASLQTDEEQRRARASLAVAPAAPLPAAPSRRGGRGGRGARGRRGGAPTSTQVHVARVPAEEQEAAVASAQPVLTLADAGDITGRNDIPESSLGGTTTCIVCMAHPKSHLAVPCGHLGTCGTCAERMQLCPYCRAPVREWVQARII